MDVWGATAIILLLMCFVLIADINYMLLFKTDRYFTYRVYEWLRGYSKINNMSSEEREECAGRPDLKVSHQKYLVSHYDNYDVIKRILSSPLTSPKTLVLMAKNATYLYADAIAHPNFPVKRMKRICRRENNQHILAAVAENPRLPISGMKRLIVDRPMVVQRALINNPSLPGKLMNEIFDHASTSLKSEIASNVNITDYIQKKIMDSDDRYIRYALSYNPAISDENLCVLLSDQHDAQIRKRASVHPKINLDYVKLIYALKYKGYVDQLLSIPITPAYLINEMYYKMKSRELGYVSSAYETAAYRYIRMTHQEYKNGMFIPYKHHFQPDEDGKQFSHRIKFLCAKNPNCPPDILADIANESMENGSNAIINAILEHPNTPQWIKDYISLAKDL